MDKRLVTIRVLAAALAALSVPARAQGAGDETRSEIELLKQRVAELEASLGAREAGGGDTGLPAPVVERLGRLEEEVDRLGYAQRRGASLIEGLDGIEFGGWATAIAQGVTGGGDALETGRLRGVNFSGDLYLAVPVGQNGALFVRTLVGQGSGVADALPPGFSGPNADLEVNDDSAKLVEAWYEATLPHPTVVDRRVSLALGKMDPTGFFDGNNVANDETQQFLADIFVNNLAVDWGGDENGYGFGSRLAWRFTSVYEKSLEVEGQVGVFEVGGGLANTLGAPFVIGELDGSRRVYGLLQSYRLYAWTNQGEHVRLADLAAGKSAASWGWGLSLDRQLTGDCTLFARYGWQDPSVSTFDHVASLGGQLVGNGWGRGGDLLGLALGHARASSSFGRVSSLLDGAEVSGGETYAEAYYSYFVDGGTRLTPDVQYVHRPGGVGAAEDRLLFGLRAQLDF